METLVDMTFSIVMMTSSIFIMTSSIVIMSVTLHDNSNSDNSNSYEIFQGAISQNII